jgi:hypothetical protein
MFCHYIATCFAAGAYPKVGLGHFDQFGAGVRESTGFDWWVDFEFLRCPYQPLFDVIGVPFFWIWKKQKKINNFFSSKKLYHLNCGAFSKLKFSDLDTRFKE